MRTAALVSVFCLALPACTGGGAPPAGLPPEDEGCVWVIGAMGGGTPEVADLRKGMLQGIEFAVEEAAGPGGLACRVELRVEDTRPDLGDRVPALTQAAQRMVENDRLVACVCPFFSGETAAVGQLFSDIGVPFIGSDPDGGIPAEGYDNWFRAIPNESLQGPAAGEYIAEGLEPKKVAIVHDNRAYSRRLANAVKLELGLAAVGPFVVSPGGSDYSGVVKQIKTLKADLVYYAGFAPEAAQLVRQMRNRNVGALFVSTGAAKQPAFGAAAEDAADGAVVTCACADVSQEGAGASFASQMSAAYGEGAPGAYAAEMYDVTTFVIRALREQPEDAAIADVRARISDFFFTATALPGLARDYTWDSQGELEADPLRDTWVYEWDGAREDFVSLGRVEELV